MRRLVTKFRLVFALAAVALVLLLGGCKDGDDGKDKTEVEDAVRSLIEAYTDKDSDAFLAALTDKGLAELFGVSEEELADFKAQLPQFIGEDPPVIRSFANTEVSGETATTELESEGTGTIEIDRFHLVRVEDAWKVDGFEGFVVSPDIPDGYTVIDLPVQEFAFGLDPTQVETGKVAFKVRNVGQQPHEVPLLRLAEGVILEEALQSEGQPEGIEFVGRIEIQPGKESNMVLLNDLTPGRYALVCFFPDTEDPEGTPHAFKGMQMEFELE